MLRNAVLLNIHPRGLRTAVQEEMRNPEIAMDKKIADNLRLFNGLKGTALILACWGMTFFFSWYSILSNQNEIADMLKSWTFNIVSCAVYAVPIFFYCSGFLQTHALL